MSDEQLEEPEEKLIEPIGKTDVDVLDAILQASPDDIIPWEKVALPSEGIYYDGAIPNGEVEVKGWGLASDKILATSRLAQSGQSLNYIYKKYVRLPKNFDHMSLLAGDRIFLLYYMRGVTYGNEYEFLIECNDEDCEHVWSETYDMNQLVTTRTGPNMKLGKEPFKVVLPYFSEYAGTEVWVMVRLLRGYDIDIMTSQKKAARKLRPTARARARAKTKKGKKISEENLDKTIEANLRMVIVEAMGDADRGKIDKLVARMHARDTATIREFLRDNSPGIDTSIEVKCPECNNQITMDLPITESFFRPKNYGGAGE